jgi:hypothetical protein
MSSSSGYVAIPRCPVIFDGANYPDFAAFMRVHMRGLRLWGVLSSEVSCPPCPTPPVAPIPPTPSVLGDDATQADKNAAESADRSAVATYDLQFQQYSSALETYRLDLTAYTQWMDEMLVLQLFSFPVFYHSLSLSLWVFLLLLTCGLIFVSATSHPGMLFIYLWFVRSMPFSRVSLLLMSSTNRVLLSGISLTLFALRFVVPAHALGRCARTWSFSASCGSWLSAGAGS